MSRPSLNDWQMIQTRKEVEELHKLLSKPDGVNYALMAEILFLLLGFGFDYFLSGTAEGEKSVVAIVTLGITAAALIITIMVWSFRQLRRVLKKKIQSKVKGAQEIIDIIDNKLCYNLMTAQAMYELGIGVSTESEKFHLIETSYYLNKCSDLLTSVKNNLSNALVHGTCENDYLSGKISAVRIANMIAIMQTLYTDVEKTIDDELQKGKSGSLTRIKEENMYFKRNLNEMSASIAEYIQGYPQF